MTEEDKDKRIKLFLQLIDAFEAHSWVDNIYQIVSDYDLPQHLDRDFVMSALEKYYAQREEYEKCANLVKWKDDLKRKDLDSLTNIVQKETPTDEKTGFKIPNSIRERFLKNKKK